MMGGGYAGMIIFMPVIGVLSAVFVLIFNNVTNRINCVMGNFV